MKIAASIVFDSAYVESALITAHELSHRDQVFKVLHLIFVNRGTDEDVAVKQLLADFCCASAGPVAMHAIEVVNTLIDFTSRHFNNSIIYKALVPALVPGSPFILNLDSGVLLGKDFDAYVDGIVTELCTTDASWVIAANTLPVEGNLTPEQLEQPHSDKYPTGAVLLFNTRQYLASEWNIRYLLRYAEIVESLRYAEQELISLVVRDGELVDLPGGNKLTVGFLGGWVLSGSAEALPVSAADDSIFFKFAGSFKPWKYWVLDPNKVIYTRRRDKLEASFSVTGNPVIEANRESCMRPQWALEFLKLYENYLVERAR